MKKDEFDKKFERLWKENPEVQDPKLKESSWAVFSTKAFPQTAKKIEKRRWQWAAAAVITAMLAIGSLLVYQNSNFIQQEAFELVENTTLQVKRVQLSDGSIIELDPNSKLKYAKNFEENRTIILKGTAFFQVKKDKSHPFTVQCDRTTTTVLGTSFTIGQQGKQRISVRLYEGSVRMDIADTLENWVLEPGDEFIYDNKQVSIKTFERFMDFENANLKDIVTYIESNYHYEFILPQKLLQQSLTLRINKKERFENVVQIIAKIYNLEPEIDQELKTVKFHL